MTKNEIFTFTAPNGVEVTAVVITTIKFTDSSKTAYLCYAQNRLFEMYEEPGVCDLMFNFIIVDYCILPDYDAMLKAAQ